MNYVTKKEFQALVERVDNLESLRSSGKLEKRKQSIREFILEKNAETNIDKCICLLYFLEESGDDFQDGISSGDLKKVFQKAREKVPGNVSDVLQRCAKKGWIDQSGNDDRIKKWKLTNTGVQYVKELSGSEA